VGFSKGFLITETFAGVYYKLLYCKRKALYLYYTKHYTVNKTIYKLQPKLVNEYFAVGKLSRFSFDLSRRPSVTDEQNQSLWNVVNDGGRESLPLWNGFVLLMFD